MDSSIITGIISASSALLVGIISVVSSIVVARTTSHQKENEACIKDLTEKLVSMKEDKYLDIIKEWTAESKKSIKEDVEKGLQA